MKEKKVVVEHQIGEIFKVALNLLLLPLAALRSRYTVGVNFKAVFESIRDNGQRDACGVQLLSEDEAKANPGKLYKLTDGMDGRLIAAQQLERELLVVLHEPYTDLQILEWGIGQNGDKSPMSAMDICFAGQRLEKLGVPVEKRCKMLSGAAGKQLKKQTLWQYERLTWMPVEIQKMAHLGAVLGGINPSTVLHMTNTVRTPDQYALVVKNAKERLVRELHEEWERDQAYIEREKEEAIKEAMGLERSPEPPRPVKKTRARTADSPLTVADVKKSEAELFGKAGVDLEGKDDRTDPNPPEAKGTPMTHEEWVAQCAELAAMGGMMEEAAKLLLNRHLHNIDSATFCQHLKALIENGRGAAKVARRKAQEAAGEVKPLEVVPPVTVTVHGKK